MMFATPLIQHVFSVMCTHSDSSSKGNLFKNFHPKQFLQKAAQAFDIPA